MQAAARSQNVLVQFLDSLHRRYTDATLDKSLVNLIIGDLFGAVTYNEATEANFRAFIADGKTDAINWMPARAHLYTYADRYQALGTLLSMYSEK